EIPKKFFDHEKKIILRALDNQKEDPMKQAFKAFYRMVFNSHPYSLDLAGNPETIKTFSPTGLQKLHQSHLKNSEIVITYCGDLDFSVVHQLVCEKFKKTTPRKAGKKDNPQAKGLIGKSETLPFTRVQSTVVIGTRAYAT